MAALTRMRVDLATGKIESKTYDSGTDNEFPRINPAYSGKRQRYAYIACNPSARRWACSSSSRASTSRPAPWRGTISARAAILASRFSSPRARAEPRMMASW